ncbi:MAG: thioredoxin domain-containing protein [Polyangiaceae bacterium]|nr:thioredoxin domain-containing protein [Polyangiaceae bacterium]
MTQEGSSDLKVFINYRRSGDTSRHVVGRVYDRLCQDLGKECVFMDVDAIPFGVDFVDYLERQITQCAYVLAVIGPGWLEARNERGERRLDDPNDWVRVELRAALSRGIPVVPVLVDGGHLPQEHALPADLASLPRRQALTLTDRGFHHELGHLVDQIRTAQKPEPTAPAADPAEPDGACAESARTSEGSTEVADSANGASAPAREAAGVSAAESERRVQTDVPADGTEAGQARPPKAKRARAAATKAKRDRIAAEHGRPAAAAGVLAARWYPTSRTGWLALAGVLVVVVFLILALGRGTQREPEPDPHARSTDEVDHSGAPVPVTALDPQWGEPDAPVTLVEISDLQCPFCARVLPTLEKLKAEYGPQQLRLVWKNNPLPFHKDAKPAAVAGATVHALAGDEVFWKFSGLAFAHQDRLNEESFAAWAREAGVNVEEFRAAFGSGKYTSKVDQDIDMARKIGVTGTPSFRINGVTVEGAQPYEKFKDIVDQQLQEAKRLIASGTPKRAVYVELTARNVAASPEQHEQDAAPAPDESRIWQVPISKKNPQKGPDDALVTVVEFSEFQCPFCQRVQETLKRITDKYGPDVRLVWKNNPLPFHKRALPAAALAMTAFEQKGNEGFWKAHDLLFESQRSLEDGDLKRIAARVGVSWTSTRQATGSDRFKDAIATDQELAEYLEARGTPYFFINGQVVRGAQPFEKFDEVIGARLAEARSMVSRGVPRAAVYDEIMKQAAQPRQSETG